MKLSVLVVFVLVATATALDMNAYRRMRASLDARRRTLSKTWTTVKDLTCDKAMSGYEQEVILKDASGKRLSEPKGVSCKSHCGYEYNDVFGHVKLGSETVLEVKADDHCKMEFSTVPVMNKKWLGPKGKDQLVAAAYATQYFMTCGGKDTTVQACLDGFDAAVAGVFPTMKYVKFNDPDLDPVKTAETFRTCKIGNQGVFQYNAGIPLAAWDLNWSGKAIVDPLVSDLTWLIRKGKPGPKFTYEPKGKVCDPTVTAKLAAKPTEQQFCILRETLAFQTAWTGAFQGTKEVHWILPKVDMDEDALAKDLNAKLTTAGVPKPEMNVAPNGETTLTGNPVPMFDCRGNFGVVSEIRYGPNSWLKDYRALNSKSWGKTLPTKAEVEKVVGDVLKLQEDIWVKVDPALKTPDLVVDLGKSRGEQQEPKADAPRVASPTKPTSKQCEDCCKLTGRLGKRTCKSKGSRIAKLDKCKLIKDNGKCKSLCRSNGRTLGFGHCIAAGL